MPKVEPTPINLPWTLRSNNTIADSTGKTVADVRFASKQGSIIVALANAQWQESKA